ncbi:helix-turn-helix transcriptional regulator [Nonomuraea sp. ZG12]|uniref:helix-turn-helix transcriptional regulator n=1 Tax=Nonomuraea sp. ZG12 TaxID=3452207 RepID=UPI003F8C21E8
MTTKVRPSSDANALKHAEATTIEVRLDRAAGRLSVAVVDDGKGFGAGARRGPATLADRHDVRGEHEALTTRERDVLREMAHGRSNGAIARALHLSVSSVGKNVNSIFTELGLENSADVHRRVAAVLAYLRP